MPANRDESFVPLAPAVIPANDRSDYRVTVMSNAEKAQPFNPLSRAGAAAAPSQNIPHEPRISVQREGDRVSSIQIQCNCGQIIELACVYDPSLITEAAPPSEPAFVVTPSPAPAPPVSASAPVAPPVAASAPLPQPEPAAPPPPASTPPVITPPHPAPPAPLVKTASVPPAKAAAKKNKPKKR